MMEAAEPLRLRLPRRPGPRNDAAMHSVFLVRAEHLNHQGHLFGGDLMAEIDTVAYCLLRERFPGRAFVTRAAAIEFVAPAHIGDIIGFAADVERVGVTSVAVRVVGAVGARTVCRAQMTYVSIDDAGRKCPIG